MSDAEISGETLTGGKRHGSFAADVLKLVTGTGSAQIIGILAAPLIARLFSPEAFGLVAVFAAASSIISVVVCLRYDLAIVLPKHDEDAAKVVSLCLVLVTILTSLTVLLVWLAGHGIMVLAKATALEHYIWLLPPSVFFTGLMAILNAWNTRQHRFGRITAMQVVSRCCITLLQIVLGFAGFVSGGVLIACALLGGSVIPSFILGVLSWRDSSTVLLRSARWENIRYAFRRYSRFPKYSTGSAILGSSSSQIPVLLLSAFFSPSNAGQYSMGARLLRVPVLLIGNNFRNAFFPRAAEARHRGTLDRPVETGYRYLVAFTMFPCLLLMVVGRDLFVVAFGSRWAEAGVYAQIQALSLMFWFLSSPLNNVLLVLEEQALELRLQALISVSRLVSFVIGGLLGSARLAIGMVSLTGAMIYVFYTTIIFRKVGIPPFRMVRVLLMHFLMFLPAGSILLTLKYFNVRPLHVVLASFFFLIVYFSNFVRIDPLARQTISGALRRLRAPRVPAVVHGSDSR